MKTFPTAPAPHIPAGNRVRRVMGDVLLALLPGAMLHLYFFGFGLVFQLALAVAAGLLVEASVRCWRGAAASGGIADVSTVVTAALLAMSITPLAPWWVAVTGMFVALGLGKYAYGGLGANLLNPAMAGCAFALMAFPRELAHWPGGFVGLGDAARAVFAAAPAAGWDTLASATPLDATKQLVAQGLRLPELHANALYQRSGAAAWAWIALALALGGVYLLWRRVIGWHAPAGVILTTIALTLPVWLLDTERHPSPLAHLTAGGLMLAAWFIATDPVSGCTSPRGRFVFGCGVAALTLAIRRWGHLPDGVAFVVLFMNQIAPLIDLNTRPRIYGHGRG